MTIVDFHVHLTALGKVPEAGRRAWVEGFPGCLDAGVASGLDRAAAVEAATATARGTLDMVARRPETPEQLKLLTGLRPLPDAEARQLVATVIQAALTRMNDVERGFTG